MVAGKPGDDGLQPHPRGQGALIRRGHGMNGLRVQSRAWNA